MIETPESLSKADLGGPRHGPDFQNLHRNKRSATLNLKHPEGLAILRRLIEDADVLLENYRPDVKFRLGIDYESLAAINPRMIYASVSGFGQDGPYRERPGFDQIAQGMGGLMSITGLPGAGPGTSRHRHRRPGRRPFCGHGHLARADRARCARDVASGFSPRSCRRRSRCWTSRRLAGWWLARCPDKPATITRPASQPVCSPRRTIRSTSRPTARRSSRASALP